MTLLPLANERVAAPFARKQTAEEKIMLLDTRSSLAIQYLLHPLEQ